MNRSRPSVRRLALAFAVGALAWSSAAFAAEKAEKADLPVVSFDKAAKHVGETVIVEGTIVQAKKLDNICFLNFHKDFRNHLTAVVFGSDFDKFDGSPDQLYGGRQVRIRGEIGEYKGRPQIKVHSPDQVEIVGGAEESEAAAEGGGEAVEIAWDRADEYYGREVIVTGRIVRTHNSGKACFLNFHNNFKRYLTAVIFASDYDKFPAAPEECFLDKEVRVRGKVKEYQGKPEIVLKKAEQIEIVEPAETEDAAPAAPAAAE